MNSMRAGLALLLVVTLAIGSVASEAPPTVDTLLEDLGAAKRDTRIAALKALAARWGSRGRIVPIVVAHLAVVTDPKEATAALRALVHLPNGASRDALVKEALGKRLEGLADVFAPSYRRDVLGQLARKLPASLAALERLTGQRFDMDGVAWQKWIAAQPPVSRPREGGVPVLKTPAERAGPTFFGLTVSRTDVVFLLDASASMRENNQLARVKEAARAVVKALGPADRFNIVFFAARADSFRKRMVQADASIRDTAYQFIQRQKAGGGTDLGAGLQAALSDERVKEIVLFSDGLPTRGAVRTSQDALRRIGQRKVSVHVVVSGPGGAAHFFELARRTGGRTVVASQAR